MKFRSEYAFPAIMGVLAITIGLASWNLSRLYVPSMVTNASVAATLVGVFLAVELLRGAIAYQTHKIATRDAWYFGVSALFVTILISGLSIYTMAGSLSSQRVQTSETVNQASSDKRSVLADIERVRNNLKYHIGADLDLASLEAQKTAMLGTILQFTRGRKTLSEYTSACANPTKRTSRMCQDVNVLSGKSSQAKAYASLRADLYVLRARRDSYSVTGQGDSQVWMMTSLGFSKESAEKWAGLGWAILLAIIIDFIVLFCWVTSISQFNSLAGKDEDSSIETVEETPIGGTPATAEETEDAPSAEVISLDSARPALETESARERRLVSEFVSEHVVHQRGSSISATDANALFSRFLEERGEGQIFRMAFNRLLKEDCARLGNDVDDYKRKKRVRIRNIALVERKSLAMAA